MPLQQFPGLIDVHVHLRDPGLTHKEDFYTGSRAALKGGFTFMLDMPNNPVLTTSVESLNEKIHLSSKSLIDVGFYFGTTGENTHVFSEIDTDPHIYGLKIYCNLTTGNYVVRDAAVREKIIAAWTSKKPIAVHAEGEMVAEMIDLAIKYDRRMHICHVARHIEVEAIRSAKRRFGKLSAGVTPHHLFLTNADKNRLGSYACMKPELGNMQDQNALWDGLCDGTIDMVESDHAPHTVAEKKHDTPPFGVPGLETTLGLLWKAVHDKKIKSQDILRWLYDNPKELFSIPDQPQTYLELDPDRPYQIGENGYETKCGWSPFDGWEAYGQVQTLIYLGNTIISAGKFTI